jgi:hypothetical protein
LPGTGADRRQTGTFEPRERRFIHRAGQHRADPLVGIEDRHVALAESAGQRGTAVHKHRRHVAAHHAHHDARQGLVTAAKADEPVIGKPVHDRLDRVGDQFARHQRELHALVIHADAVGDRDRRELARRATSLGDPLLGRLDLEGVGHVARRLLALH